MKIKLLLTSLLFCLISWLPSISVASSPSDDSASVNVQALTDTPAVKDKTDASLTYMGEVFGNVDGRLPGATSQIIEKLIGKFNQGIFILIGMWLIYTIVTTVLRAAQEGSFNGANKNLAITFFKIALGVSLAIPTSSGYSMLQKLVMDVAIDGVGFADQVWGTGLDYLQDNNVLWSGLNRDMRSGVAQNLFKDDQLDNFLFPNGTLGGLMMNEQCLANAVRESRDGEKPMAFDINIDRKHHSYNFPNASSQVGCGSISWNLNSACKKGSTGCETARVAVYQLIQNTLPAARRYYCSLGDHADSSFCRGVSTDNVTNDNRQSVLSAVITFANMVMPLMQQQVKIDDSHKKDFIANAKTQGWLTAGRYYWDMAKMVTAYKVNGKISSYYPSIQISKICKAGKNQPSYCHTANYNKFIQQFFKHNANTQEGTDHYGISNSNVAKESAKGAAAGPITGVAFGVLYNSVNRILKNFDQRTNHTIDPILFLHELGYSCLRAAGDFWYGIGIAIFALSIPAAVCQGMFNGRTLYMDALDWMKPIFMVVASCFWAVGFVLAYYVPLYPFMIYLFGIIGWLISLIEALIAAPLICLGLTHPEGHDFLGEAKQAVILLLGVFLRPVLMVLGLIAAMILSYVALQIVIDTYGGFMRDMLGVASHSTNGSLEQALYSSISARNPLTPLLVIPVAFVAFTAIVYTVTTYCYNLIYLLGDNILRWIGGPQTQSLVQQMAQEVKGVFSGAGSKSGELGSNTVGGRLNTHIGAKGADMLGLKPIGGAKISQGAGPGGGGNDAMQGENAPAQYPRD